MSSLLCPPPSLQLTPTPPGSPLLSLLLPVCFVFSQLLCSLYYCIVLMCLCFFLLSAINMLSVTHTHLNLRAAKYEFFVKYFEFLGYSHLLVLRWVSVILLYCTLRILQICLGKPIQFCILTVGQWILFRASMRFLLALNWTLF